MLQNLKKIFRANRDIRLHNFGPRLSQYFPYNPKKRKKFRKFHLRDFSVFVVLYHIATLEENSCAGSWDISLRVFGPQLGQIFAHLAWKRIFRQISLTVFFLLLASFLQNQHKIIRVDPEKFYKVENFTDTQTHKHTQTDKPTTISLST